MDKLNRVEIKGTAELNVSVSYKEDTLMYGNVQVDDTALEAMLAEALAKGVKRDENGRFYGQAVAKVTILIEPLDTGLEIKVE